MALSVGTQIGAYKIVGKIGSGGMGEVYRATDTKLGRQVAIKTLPEGLTEDSDRRARFEREAKLLASLNHGHIASVYGLDEHEGALYIAMELVEGETLATKLQPGPLSVDDALQLGLQIALAIEAAHEKGVIHRDLKPANIMITHDGVAKVLDFGLAKALSQEVPGQTHALELTADMVQRGRVIGTPTYMSPEQATGQIGDQRIDVWAFGAVLYEMLTGVPLFRGDSATQILAEVLKTEPGWDRLPAGLHPRLKLLLERCLTKNPRNRLHSIADARIEVESVLSNAEGGIGHQTSGVLRRRRLLPWIAASTAATTMIAAVVAWSLWPATQPRPVERFEQRIPEGVTLRGFGRPLIAVSPNGRHFAFNTEQGLYLRRLAELEARRIPGTESGLTTPFFSPDGQSIGYYADGRFWRVPISGGAPIVIGSASLNPWGARWESDGTILAGQPDGIVRFSEDGGEPEVIIPVRTGNERLYGPQLLPDGDSVLFSVTQTADWNTGEIVVESISTGERTPILSGGHDARYLPSGHLLYAYEDELFGVAFDPSTPGISGERVSLVQGLTGGSDGISPAANYDFSDGGTLVYASGVQLASASNTLVWADRSGNETAIPIGTCGCVSINLSPDGARVAITDYQVARGDSDVLIWSFESRTPTALTFAPGLQGEALWDGDDIVYTTVDTGELWRVAADGSGAAVQLFDELPALFPYSIGPDGKVVLARLSDANDLDIRVLNLGGQPTLETLLGTPSNEMRPSLSPDGRWLAYESDESGQSEIYVSPYPLVDGSGIRKVSESGGTMPRWSPNGGQLYFLSPTHLMEAQVELEPSFRWERPEALFEYSLGAVPQTWRTYDVAADGRFLMIKPAPVAEQADDESQIVIVRNWADELERRVPID